MINKDVAESIWITSTYHLSLIKGFGYYSRASLFRKIHEIRAFVGKPPSSGFLSSPVSLWDVSQFLRVDVNRIVDEKTLEKLKKGR